MISSASNGECSFTRNHRNKISVFVTKFVEVLFFCLFKTNFPVVFIENEQKWSPLNGKTLTRNSQESLTKEH